MSATTLRRRTASGRWSAKDGSDAPTMASESSPATPSTKSRSVAKTDAPTKDSGRSSLKMIIGGMFFVGGQAAVMLIGQGLRVRGVKPTTLISVVPIYAGILLVGLANKLRAAPPPSGAAPKPRIPASMHLKLAGLSAMHFSGFLLFSAAIEAAGPALFSVVYSSQPLLVGIIAWLLLNNQLAMVQWAAFFLMVGGLVMASLAAHGKPDEGDFPQVGSDGDGDAEASPTVSLQVLWGFVLSLGSAIILSLNSVMSEAVLRGKTLKLRCNSAAPSADVATKAAPIDVATVQISRALSGFAIACVVWSCWSYPRWDGLFVEPVGAAAAARDVAFDSVVWEVLQLCVGTAAATLAMSGGYFSLAVLPGGSVLLAALSPASSVVVAILSHALYCDASSGADECVTLTKTATSAVVLSGVILFVTGKRSEK